MVLRGIPVLVELPGIRDACYDEGTTVVQYRTSFRSKRFCLTGLLSYGEGTVQCRTSFWLKYFWLMGAVQLRRGYSTVSYLFLAIMFLADGVVQLQRGHSSAVSYLFLATVFLADGSFQLRSGFSSAVSYLFWSKVFLADGVPQLLVIDTNKPPKHLTSDGAYFYKPVGLRKLSTVHILLLFLFSCSRVETVENGVLDRPHLLF